MKRGLVLLVCFAAVSAWGKTHPVFARARLLSLPKAKGIGLVQFAASDRGLLVRADVRRAAPGTHQLHLHAGGDCSRPGNRTHLLGRFTVGKEGRGELHVNLPIFRRKGESLIGRTVILSTSQVQSCGVVQRNTPVRTLGE